MLKLQTLWPSVQVEVPPPAPPESKGAEELPHAQRLVQVEHRLVQAVFKVVPVEDGDAARGNVHVG